MCWIPVGIQSILLFSNVHSPMYSLCWTFIRHKLELSTGNNSQKPTSCAQVSGVGPAELEACAVSGIWMSRCINKLSKIHDFLPVSYSEKHQMFYFSHDFTHQEDSGKAKNLMLFATAGNFSCYIAPIILFYNYISHNAFFLKGFGERWMTSFEARCLVFTSKGLPQCTLPPNCVFLRVMKQGTGSKYNVRWLTTCFNNQQWCLLFTLNT